MSRGEWIMLATFVLLLLLWVFGDMIGVDATSAAFVGVAILLIAKVLTWKDMAANGGAWSTLIFFSVLVGMATHLNTLGVIKWIGDEVAGLVGGMPWMAAFAVLNVTENHLDRYAGLAEYANAKARIFAGSGVQVVNRDDPRSFAMRKRSDGTPSKRVMTTCREKTTRAVGRENLAKTRPVTRARPSSPTSASTVTRTFAGTPRGAIFP